MKNFFLGIGVGLILAGVIINFDSNQKIQIEDYENVESKKEIKEIRTIKTSENQNDIELRKILNENQAKKEELNINQLIKKAVLKKEGNPKKEINNNKKYTIQLGAYGKLENATELKNKIKKLPLKIIKKDNIYKVLTEKLLTKQDADKYIIILKKDYNVNAYIKINK